MQPVTRILWALSFYWNVSQYDSGKIQLPGVKTGLQNSFQVLCISNAPALSQRDLFRCNAHRCTRHMETNDALETTEIYKRE